MRLLLGAAFAIAAIVIHAAPAAAVPGDLCGDGKRFDENRGTCVAVVAKDSKGKKFRDAMDHLEGRAKRPNPKKGIKALEGLCKDQYAAACTQLAFIHLNGRHGTTRDPSKALGFYEKACKAKDTDGCIGAFEIHHQGQLGAGTMDSSKGLPYLEKACTLKSGRGCQRLGQLYNWGGTNIAQDQIKAEEHYKKAFPLLEKDCKDKDGASCATLGLIYQDPYNTRFKLDGAVDAFERGCKAHSGEACYYQAYLYDPEAYLSYVPGRDKLLDPSCPPPTAYGQQPTPPPATCFAKSFKLYEKACTNYDNFDSCYKAGTWIVDAKVDTRSATVNVELMAKRVCELSEYSCNLWARLKDSGTLVPLDAAGALDLYVKSCNAGNSEGCKTAADRYYYSGQYKDAVTFMEKSCDLWDALSCTRAGGWHLWGDTYSGIPKNLARAQELFTFGCYRGDVEGCMSAGQQLLDGNTADGTPRPADATEFFSYACGSGQGRGCFVLAEMYANGKISGSADLDTALGYYEQACFGYQSYDYNGCVKTVELRRDGARKDLTVAGRAQTVLCKNWGSVADCQQADKFFKEAKADYYTKQELSWALDAACNQQYPIDTNCIALALMYRDGGYSVDRNPAQAITLLQGVCDRGYTVEACYHLGVAYEKGLGVGKDQETARLLYTRACDGWYRDGCVAAAKLAGDPKREVEVYTRLCYDEQHPQACSGAASAYHTARGVDWDTAEAYRLYDRACELNDYQACSQKGVMWQYGIGQEVSPARAYEAYQRACDGGYQRACGRAASFIERGEGGAAKDPAKAEQLYTLACEQGESPDACRWLAELLDSKPTKNAPQIAKLKQRALNLAKAQSTDSPYAVWQLGTFHRDGVATLKSPEKAAELFSQACEANLALGCLDAGRMNMGEGGLAANLPVAIVHLDKACAANVAEACRLAEQAKGGGTPGVVTKPKTGCCDAGASPGGGAALALLVLGLLTARGRRRLPSARAARR